MGGIVRDIKSQECERLGGIVRDIKRQECERLGGIVREILRARNVRGWEGPGM